MARLLSAGAAAVIAGSAGLAFAAASSPRSSAPRTAARAVAQTFGEPYAVPLHQQQELPITAADFHNHVTCIGVPPTKDGWHFVLPHTGAGHVVHRFVELTVDFDKGNGQVEATFTEDRSGAYVGSVAGARLLRAAATVETEHGHTLIEWFNLSHTCPASKPVPPTPETPTPECPTPPGGGPVAPFPVPENGEPATLYPPALPGPSPVGTCFAVTG